MHGAVVGDFVGSRFEFDPIKSKDFELVHEGCIWTDDSVLTIAVADALASNLDMVSTIRRYTVDHVTSYGPHFWGWANGWYGDGPYGSWGNGAAMRVSPAAWFATSVDDCLQKAALSAEISHNHPEGVRGAQAVACAVYAAIMGRSQNEIRSLIQSKFGYDLSSSVDELRSISSFELKSWISVPRAIVCVLEATSFEDAIRNAISLGGDADTEAAIAGSIAEPLFGVPDHLKAAAVGSLPVDLQERLSAVVDAAALIRRTQISSSDFANIPVWDPSVVENWNAAQEAQRPVVVYEADPIETVESEERGAFVQFGLRILRGWFDRK